MPAYVALLRGINVSGANKIPMVELRALAEELGWDRPETYIQSGNLVFGAAAEPSALETALEAAIEQRFGLKIPVVIRSAEQWTALAARNPFPEAAQREPNRVQLLVSKKPPEPGAAERLMDRAQDGEAVGAAGDALWLYYPAGVANSKLTPAAIDKAVGSPTTGRNWRTVLKIAEMLRR